MGMGISSVGIVASRLPLANGKILVGQSNGRASAVTPAGDVTIVAAGTTTIGAGKVTEAMQVLADNTTNDVSASKHGYAPKIPNNTTTFLRGDGTYAAPTGGVTGYTLKVASGTITNQAGETVVCSVVFTGLTATNMIRVTVYIDGAGGTGGSTSKIQIYDGTNTAITANIGGFSNAEAGVFSFILVQKTATNTAGWLQGADLFETTLTQHKYDLTGLNANWMTGSVTIRAVATSETGSRVYRLVAEAFGT